MFEKKETGKYGSVKSVFVYFEKLNFEKKVKKKNEKIKSSSPKMLRYLKIDDVSFSTTLYLNFFVQIYLVNFHKIKKIICVHVLTVFEF